jgi:GntR family transcriptional regulator/MocR family aminotransferase
VTLHGLQPYRIAASGRPGLIFGFATLREREIADGIAALGAALVEARCRTAC